MLLKRLGVALVGIPLALYITRHGGWPLSALTAAAMLGMVYEASMSASRAIQDKARFRRYFLIDLLASAGLFAAVTRGVWMAPAFCALALFWVACGLLAYPTSRDGLFRWLFSTFAIPYICAGALSFYVLARLDWKLGVLALAVCWAADTAAYAAGHAVGRHKLAPSISPNKSVEGAVAGVVAAALVTALFARFSDLPVGVGAAVGALLGVAAVAGDLLESKLKRGLDIKDFGSGLPGHGGLLDRLDSLLLVAPVLLLIALRLPLIIAAPVAAVVF